MPDTPAIREVFVEVGRFTGAAGGRIKVTRELYDWIVARSFHWESELRKIAERQGLSSKIPRERIVEEIVDDLFKGMYNNESIELSGWTVRYIIDGRYNERLTHGSPMPEPMLVHQEKFRDQYEKLQATQRAATRQERERWHSIYMQVKNHPELLVSAGRATDYSQIAEIFPLVTWPEDFSLPNIKDDILFAVALKPTAIRGRKRKPGIRRQGRMTEYTEFTDIPEE